MRIAFTGGGTGGHIFPNIAVIGELKAIHAARRTKERLELIYIGEKNSLEEKLMRKLGVSFHGIRAGKLRRYFALKNIVDAVKVPLGCLDAYQILKKRRPDLVFAKGGYVSMPVLVAAWFLKIPVWLHESDATPGLATKFCSRFAKEIWLSFEETKKFFSGKMVHIVGNPIRREILAGSREEGYRMTGFSPDKPVVLVMGGSTGALSLNTLVEKILPKLLQSAQVVHVTGRHPAAATNKHGYRRFEFLDDDLSHIYAIADCVVSRAGSGSIFELLALGKPFILIPLPRSASRGDQIENAKICEKNGWALVFDQDKTTSSKLLDAIIKLLRGDVQLKGSKTEKIRFTHAARKIAEAMLHAG